MKIKFYLVLGALGILVASSCQKNKNNDQVVSQRYIHKYGYAVSKDEWNSRQYPGQVITALRNGVTVTATYESGILHGPCTHTFPHSQTIESYYMYNQGLVIKEVLYDVKGMPVREEVQLSATRFATTLWYADGAPMSVEEYINEELLEGQYYNVNNETEARVEKGNGHRIRRDQQGILLAKEDIEAGLIVKRQTFYANGAPESLLYFTNGKIHGEKKMFAQNGEPLVHEEWIRGKLHGKSTYYKNGIKYLEISFLDGEKNGMETHYVDGVTVSQEVQWENDLKHGPTIYFVDGGAHTEWYFAGDLVSKKRFDDFTIGPNDVAKNEQSSHRQISRN